MGRRRNRYVTNKIIYTYDTCDTDIKLIYQSYNGVCNTMKDSSAEILRYAPTPLHIDYVYIGHNMQYPQYQDADCMTYEVRVSKKKRLYLNLYKYPA